MRGYSYQDALVALDKYVNKDYYDDPDTYDHQDVKPDVMIITDDDTAELDRYGQLLTEGGSWWLKIPLSDPVSPRGNYRFDIMQKLKDEDYKEEVNNHLIATYGKEFHAFCEKQGYCESGKCEFKGKAMSDDENCFQFWYEKYKKPELDKEKKE